MQKETQESERLTLGALPLVQQEKTRRSLNYGVSVVDGVFPVQNLDIDAGDIPTNKAIVTLFDILWIIFSIFTHLFDIFADLNLALGYWMSEQMTYFIWTVIFLFVPSFVNIVVSVQMYRQDHETNQDDPKSVLFLNKLVRMIALWPIILILQLAPVLRHLNTLIFATKSYCARTKNNQAKQKKYYLKMLKEEQDIALLRVLECFLEAAPHQVLQLTIMMTDYHTNPAEKNFGYFHQYLSILSSLIGMGWAMSSYHRSIRMAQWDKENISAIGNWLQFFWHFLITISRVVAIAGAATILPIYTGVLAMSHWLIMTIWIILAISGITEFCRDRRQPSHVHPTLLENIKSYFLAGIFGVLYIFTYFKLNDGPTFRKHIIYYSVCLAENVAAALVWIFIAGAPVIEQWYYPLVPVLCIVPFIVGIIVMVIYYIYFHPRMKLIVMDQPVNANRELA